MGRCVTISAKVTRQTATAVEALAREREVTLSTAVAACVVLGLRALGQGLPAVTAADETRTPKPENVSDQERFQRSRHAPLCQQHLEPQRHCPDCAEENAATGGAW